MQVFPKIISKLKSISVIKQSETPKMLILANFKNPKKVASNYDDLSNHLIRLIDPIESHYFLKDFSKKFNKKMRSFIRKKIAKKVFYHVGYLRSGLEGLKTANLSSPLLIAKNHLSKFADNQNQTENKIIDK